jgi:hypothetical protein
MRFILVYPEGRSYGALLAARRKHLESVVFPGCYVDRQSGLLSLL